MALVPPYAFPQDKCPEAADALPFHGAGSRWNLGSPASWSGGLPRPGPPEPQCSLGGADDSISFTHRHRGRTKGLQKLFAKVRCPLQASESCGVKNPWASREEVCALHLCGCPLSAVCSPMGPECSATWPPPRPCRRSGPGPSCGISAPNPRPWLTSLVLCRHLASMSYLSSSTISTLVCRSRHRSWGTGMGVQPPSLPPGQVPGPSPLGGTCTLDRS